MKIAFVSFEFEEYCIKLASAFQDDQVMLFLPKEQSAPFVDQIGPGVDFRPFDKPRVRHILRQGKLALSIARQIRAFQPDAVHFQHGHMWFNLALPLIGRTPLVITIHDPRHHSGDPEASRVPQRIMDFGYHRADEVIVHGEQLKQVCVDDLHLPADRVHVVPHITLGDETAQSHVHEQPNTILFFGRIWEYKGLEYLIKAEPLITEQVPDAHIVIAGRGEDFDRYTQMMVHPDRFTVYNEYVPDERRAELFQQASVIALPYTDASQSGVIPVAYTFGKPVVATTVGGLPEAVDEGETGLLVAPRDERALADAIIKLLKDPDLRHRMGQNARRKNEAEWAPEVVAAQTKAVYEQASAHKHGPAQAEPAPAQAAAAPVQQKGETIALRRYPYPYKAAMTICSDIDGTTTVERFLAIQEFLNTTEETSMGSGVGLEIGNTFFPYPLDDDFGYFSSRSHDREVIETMIKAGYIDCIHSWGDGATTREQVLTGLKALEDSGCKLKVWVDHSRAPSDFGKDTTPGTGDVPDSPIYHADATLAYGIRFVWKGRGSNIVGHGVPFSLRAFSNILDRHHLKDTTRSLVKEVAKITLAYAGKERFAIHANNKFMRIHTLTDGQQVYEFQRCNTYWQGQSYGHNSWGLAYVLRPQTLKALVKSKGVMVIYTHIGVGPEQPPYLPPETQAALRNLAEVHRAGEIYITTTARLLTYYVNHKYLLWSQETNDNDETVIRVYGVADPLSGQHLPPVEDLQGITFYVPDSSRAQIIVGDRLLEQIERHPADETGRQSVSIPRTFLTYPLPVQQTATGAG